MLFSLVFQPVTSSDYSQSLTQLYVWLLAHRDVIVQLLCCATVIGYTVKQRVEYKLCTRVHRCLYGDAPAYLSDLITTSAAATGRAGLRSAASSAVAVPRTTSSFGDRSFAAAGPPAWNKLSPPLRHDSRPFCCNFQTPTQGVFIQWRF